MINRLINTLTFAWVAGWVIAAGSAIYVWLFENEDFLVCVFLAFVALAISQAPRLIWWILKADPILFVPMVSSNDK